MSTTAGVFDETLLEKALAFADAKMFADRINLQFKPQADCLGIIDAVQTARLTELESTTKDFTLRIDWSNFCAITAGDDVACATCETEGSTNAKDYTINRSRKDCVIIDTPVFLTNTAEQPRFIADALIAMEKVLWEDLAQRLISVLNTNAGINAQGSVSIGTVSGIDTIVAPANWTAQAIMPYMRRVAKYNRMTTPALLSGGLLYENKLAAEMNAGNSNGSGDNAAFGFFKPTIFDEVNMDAVNGNTDYAYLVSVGSLALASKTYFTPTLQDFGTWKGVSYASKLKPGLNFDLIVKETCSDKDLPKIDMKLRFNGDVFVNPTGCDDNNTGIIRFKCA